MKPDFEISSGSSRVIGSDEWISCLRDHSLAVVGFRTGVYVYILISGPMRL